jgi:hypothetical protein
MEIFLDKKSVRQIRQSATDAIEDGDTETLREDILDAFNEEQIEEIERRIDGGDFYDLLGDTLDDWDGDDVDQLFETLATHLGEVGIDLKLRESPLDEEEEEEAETEEEDDVVDDDPDADEDDMLTPTEPEEDL